MEFQPRKALFVDSQIQGVLLRHFSVIWFGYHLVLWHFLFLVSLFQQPPDVSLWNAYQHFVVTQPMLLIIAVAVFPPLVWGWLTLSHRIVGPLVQLRQRLQDMADGKSPKKLELRTGDLMAGLQSAFNGYVDRLEASGVHNEQTSIDGATSEDAMQILKQTDELTTLACNGSSADSDHVAEEVQVQT